MLLLAAVIDAAPASAHGTTRDGGYNVAKTYVRDGCQYEHMHGNYGGAYARGRMASSNCYFLHVKVTGCTGLYCPDGPDANTWDRGLWVASTLPGYNIIHSHNLITNDVGNYNYHNTVPGI